MVVVLRLAVFARFDLTTSLVVVRDVGTASTITATLLTSLLLGG
jgi:hypothetical protein